MSTRSDWLDLGLQALPSEQAQRIRLLRLLLETSARLRAQLDREFAPSGITSQQAAMLQLIEAHSEAPTISVMAQAMGMTHQNVKQIVLILERKGFLKIVVDQVDRRARRLQLTPHHFRFWKERNPADFAKVESWFEGLSDAEVNVAVGLLRSLNSGMNESHERVTRHTHS